ncbi:DUF4369 domain-containing protein [Lentiprolixibacter aurantiacus]|uniref:DUF4369 domain-containing protein n=1 Tax=Lentiprolixibacter aurantiacus TaxID=2993939 RepID=A0AAE3SP00_9FLAO|nr:DUF4369 domain-containing protein [Lentiprolixibacter aurantiacus]MCX2720179.1 DUF4369 domain-containing protein [Lentiprolixibacter aurantiacus]
MRISLWTLLVVIVIFSCKQETNPNEMTVSGQVKGLKKGTLFLQHVQDTLLVTVDSLQVRGDGQFSFTTLLESPEIFYLYLDKEDNNEINDRITFFAEPGSIVINTTWNGFDIDAEISGSESQKKLEEYLSVMSRFNSRNIEFLQAASDPKVIQNQEALDSLQIASDRNAQRGFLYSLNYALNNKDSYIAPYIAVKEVPSAGTGILDSIYNSLSPEVAASKYGKELIRLIEGKKGEQQ